MPSETGNSSGSLSARTLLHWTSRWRETPATVVFLISSVVVASEHFLLPSLANITPALMYGFLFLLLLVQQATALPASPGTRPTAFRLLLFLLGHLMALGLAWLVRAKTSGGAEPSALVPALAAAAAYLPILPTVLLLPWKDWQLFFKTNRPLVWAAVIFLFTFYPYRLFVTVWPWYADALGRFAFFASRPFVPDLQYSPGVNPVLTATHLDVTIVFACSGLAGVRLFQILWGLVLVVDWKTLNKKRLLFAYFAGLGVMLIANALRISLLVAVGNRISPDFVVNNHITAGWIFFTAVFTVYIFAVYRWLLADLRPTKPILRAPF